MNGVADENGVFWSAAESVERYSYGFGVWLVSGGGVAADDGIHEAGESDVREAAHSERLGFARHNGELITLLREGLDGAKDVVVASNEAVVIRELVFAVGRDEGSLVGRVAGVSPEHGEQRDADSGHPLAFGGTLPLELLERITS